MPKYNNEFLPSMWELKRVDQFIDLRSGTHLPVDEFIESGEYPVYGANGIIGQYDDWLVEPNTIIVGGVGTVGNIKLTDSKSWVTSNAIIAKIDENRAVPYYAAKALQKANIKRFASQTAQPSISQSDIKTLRLPIPPLPEQRRIAEILSTVDELIQQTDAIIEETGRLKRGLMQDLLTKGIGHESFHKVQIGPSVLEIPSSWILVDLDQIAEIKGGKRLPKEDEFSDSVTPYPYLRVIDFQNNTIITNNLKYLQKRTAQKLSKYTISKNDLFISIAGTIGKVGAIPNHLDNSFLTENAAKIMVSKDVDFNYLKYYICSHIAQNELSRRSIVTAQPKLSLYNIRNMPCILPPVHEQQEIVKHLSSVDANISKKQEIKTKLEVLKRGLMQDLLTGKVRVPVET